MKLEHMAEFVMLAETLNYTVAANRLYVSQPTLTKHVQDLEQELGTQLLDRTTHSVVLTDVGQRCLGGFREILDLYGGLKAEVDARRAGIAGSLTIGAPYYGLHEQLDPILAAMEERYPHLRLSVRSLQAHQVVEGVLDGSLDVGLIMRTSALPPERFLFQHLSYGELYFFAARGEGARPEGRPLADLRDLTLVELSEDPQYMDVIHGILEDAGVAPASTVDAHQIDLVARKLRTPNTVFLGPYVLWHMAPDELDLSRVVAPKPARLEMGFAARLSLANPALNVFLAVCSEFAMAAEEPPHS